MSHLKDQIIGAVVGVLFFSFSSCNTSPNRPAEVYPNGSENDTIETPVTPPTPIPPTPKPNPSDTTAGNGEGSQDTYIGYFLTGITDVKELILSPYSYPLLSLQEKYSSLPGIRLLVKGNRFAYRSYDTGAVFEQYARKMGDGHYPNPVSTPVDNETTLYGITEIAVEALSDYNHKHPRGSSLNPICVLSYESLYPFISSGYTSEKDADYSGESYLSSLGHTAYQHRRLSDRWQIKLPGISYAYPNWDPEDYIGNYLGFLEFTQAPDEPKQKIRVTLTLENGEKLRAETEIDFTVKP